VTCQIFENNMKFNLNNLTRLCSRSKHNSGIPCGPILNSCAAKRRAFYSTVLSTICFQALQHSRNFPIKTKRCLVSNALSRPIKSFAAPNTKLGTSMDNCTSKSSCNTCGTSKTNRRVFALPPETHNQKITKSE
jgi:hypothetical protein